MTLPEQESIIIEWSTFDAGLGHIQSSGIFQDTW